MLTAGLALAAQSALAATVTGTVSDNEGNPLTGVSVGVKGSTKGVVTDATGKYAIAAEPSETLVFSFLGFSSQEEAVGERTYINVVLSEDLQLIDEIVVVGYGVMKKSDVTSSISSVKGADLQTMTVGNVNQSLQGKVAGVQVVGGSGAPGETSKVLIRGFSSLNLSTDPLYVVDGVPMGANANFISANEIESMEVLKDASASAIYGSQASNGVIMITTKRGVVGKPVFNVDLTYGVQVVQKPYEMTNVQDYVKYMNTAYDNAGMAIPFNDPAEYANRQATDWWGSAILPTTPQLNFSFGVQGGSEAHRYSVSVSYYKHDDIYRYGGDGWNRFTARVADDFKLSKYISGGFMLNPRRETWGNPGNWSDNLRIDPITPIYLPAEELTGSENEYSIYGRSDLSTVWNTVASNKRYYATNGYYALGGNTYIDVKPIADLTFRSLIGFDYKAQEGDNFEPDFVIDAAHEHADQNKVSRNHDIYTSYSWQNTLTYLKSFGKNSLTAMVGMTMDRSTDKTLSGSREQVPNNSEILREVSAGTMNQEVSGGYAYRSLLSYFGRASYSYDRRYFLTATLRRDGSSKFMARNKWATFPSASAAWQLSNEEFMKAQSVFSSLKLRVGWGQVGNQNLPSNVYISELGKNYYVSGSSIVNTTYISTLKNEDVKWETVEDVNFGLDFAVLNSRLSGSVEYYIKNTKDMLFSKPYPFYSGYPSDANIWSNVGSMRSKGFEFLVDYKDKAGDFRYNATLTFTTFDVTATTLADGAKVVYGNSERTRTEEGAAPGYYYGYVADGIFQNKTELNAHTNEKGEFLQPNARAGDIRFRDVNGDGVLNGDDRTKIGSPWADFTAGLTINLEYKGVDLLANFYASYGNELVNQDVKGGLHNGQYGQGLISNINEVAWHGEGTSSDIPILSRNDNNENYSKFSSFYVEDGSFLRLKNLQLGYTLPKQLTDRLRLSKLRLYASGQNLWTLTKFTGVEPEIGGDILGFGFAGWTYPVFSTVLFGVNLTF
jgi:TonB-linked SusC/RagA family outer membrane protein